VFSYDLTNEIDFKRAEKDFVYLTKKCVSKGVLEIMWEKHISIEPNNMCKQLYTPESIKLLKRLLKKECGINFSEEEIFYAVHKIVTTKIEIDKPKFKM